MRLDFTLVHLSPLVNSYKGRDYFSAFVFYSANLKDLANLTEWLHRKDFSQLVGNAADAV